VDRRRVVSTFTKEELALGNRLFDVQPDSPWTAFCELRELFGSMSLERMQELYDAVAKQRIVPDAELQAALPEYKGWQASYEYPGFISYTHPDSDVMVCASSDFNGDRKLDIQIQTTGGHSFDDGENDPWPHEGRTAGKLFDRLQPYLDKYLPSKES
jgi:hypothetical protein